MKKQFGLIRLLLYCGGFLFSLSALHAASPAPTLSVQSVNAQSVQLTWPSTALGFGLEEATVLGNAISWQPVNRTPVLNGNQFTLSVTASATAQFFRLRLPEFTTIEQVSPVDGETGVAVTRETIVHFSGPLATNAVVKTNNFYAVSAGRRILSRVEMSSDRTKATLFYLEPLPGSARVNVFFDGAGLNDVLGRPLDPAGDGIPNGLKAFSFDTLALTPLTGTAVTGTVFASELAPGSDTGTNAVNKPLAGVTITVDGMEQTLRAVTDANGKFTLSPVPPGRFFVHIDGRTVVNNTAGIRYPDRSYYPYVGKAWDAVAGKTNNLAGGTGLIYLPLIVQGTLQTVSLTNDTTISFPPSVVSSNPALAGVSITVPANSLFSDDGKRGGKVGIAAVPPDRLPGPLPSGLEMPIVITVQTDGGLNFDKPAPICFPNLPDPVLKTPLPAGSKQALISFNHDKGIWEAVGSMTVSADGKMICTDPGAGILQPGWHGVGPVPDEPPPPNICSADDADDIDVSLSGQDTQVRKASQISLHGKRGKCLPPPCVPNLDAERVCKSNCSHPLESNCLIRCISLRMIKDAVCVDDWRQPGATDEAYQKCLLHNVRWQNICKLDCFDQETECEKRCEPCRATAGLAYHKVGRKSIQLAGLNDPIGDQIVVLQMQISALVEQIALNPDIVRPDLLRQIRDLLQQADALAGGDVSAYLNARIGQGEAEIDAVAAGLDVALEDLEAFTQPPYSVLYAATIARPNGQMTLRGETAPFGQYSLFVPRDGTLIDVIFYDPHTRKVGVITPNQSANAAYKLPRFFLSSLPKDATDSDRDGLADFAELVYGTDPTKADSDGDGIFDGAEIDQGTNPLDGQPVRTGIMATVKTPGSAIDVAAGNDLLAVAEGTSGVSVFNISNGMNPVLITHVPVSGNAPRVATTGNLIAVAAGDAGVQIIDISTPAAAALTGQFKMPGAQAIAADGGAAYAGFGSGVVVALDLKTGLVLNQLSVTNSVRDVALYGDYLYVLTDNLLFAVSLARGEFAIAGSTNAPASVTANQRLFVGGGIAYTVHGRGYNTFNLADPAHPVLLATGATAQFGWNHIAVNGSGIGVAAVGANPGSPAEVSLYDVSSPRTNNLFLTQFITPGTASAVTIFNGLGYVADGSAGIQVVNYLAYDNKKVPPSINLGTSAASGVVEARSPLRVTANAVDDVQVRNVEFYIDGVKASSDGNFPFEYRFEAPPPTAIKTNLTVRARAIDTGGNFTWSAELTIALGPDMTPPRVLTTAPLGGTKVLRSLLAYFNEPMNPASLNAASFRLVSTGPDGLLDTADDVPVTGGNVNYHPENSNASLDFIAPVPDGLYRAIIRANVSDLAGNQMANDYTWQLRVTNAVFWSSSTDGFWEDGSNWSTGTVPGPADVIFIESIPGDVTVFHGSSTRVIKKLVVGERVAITGGNWQISETIDLQQPLVLSRSSTLKGGIVKEVGGGKLLFAPNSTSTLDGVKVEGDLELTNTLSRVMIRNGLTLTGSVILDNTGAITFAGDQIFNTGQVIFAGTPGILGIEPGTTLTLGPAMVVRGKSGNIGQGVVSFFGTRKLINQGLIAADVAGGTITIGPSELENVGRIESKNGGSVTLSVNGAAVVEARNTGVINVSGGGTLTLEGTWRNSGMITANEATVILGGTFKLADLGTLTRTGGAVNLTGTLDLGGGTLTLNAASGSWGMKGGTLKGGTVKQTEGARLLFDTPGSMTFDSMKVEGDLVLTSTSVRALIRNGLTLTGSVVLDNTGAITFSGDQTFNSGQVIFAGTPGILGIEPGTTLTLGPAMVVRGKSGNIGQGVVSAFGMRKLINQGVITADVAGGTFTIDPSELENVGRIESKNGGSLTISANGAVNISARNAGRIEAAGGGTLTLNGPWTNSGMISANEATVNLGGTFTLADLGTFQRTGGTVNLTGVLDLGGGTLTLGAATGSWRMNAGTFKGGTVRQTEGAKLLFAPLASVTLDGVRVEGDLELTNTLTRALIRNGLTLMGSVILDNTGAITFSGDQTFNTGQVVFAGTPGVLGIEGNSTLTLGPAMVVRGKSGNIGQGVFSSFGTRKLINQGVIAADMAGGTITINPIQFENPGTLRADGTGASVVVRVTPFTNTGTIQELNGGRVLINP